MSMVRGTLALVLLLAGCGSGGGTVGRDTLTPRQRDSAIGASAIPGAQGVRGALRAADSANARAARINAATDSVP